MKSDLKLCVLLPTSLTAETSSLRQKTLKIGQIGRTLAIFCVNEVHIYKDKDPETRDQKAEAKLITTILRYMNTPQYLRKQLFPKMDELRYAGLLPPLRTPHHPLKNEKVAKGDYREAVVLGVNEEGSLLDIGLQKKGFTDEKLELGECLTVQLGKQTNNSRRIVFPVNQEEIDEYWGFKVANADSLTESINKSKADYFIGTSRRGQNLYEAIEGIKNNTPRSVGIAFGGPYQGLLEICKRQKVDANKIFDVMINTIPNQGVETVRTEEALTATLALLNVLTGSR